MCPVSLLRVGQVCTYAKKYHDEDLRVERPVSYSTAFFSKDLVLSIMQHERTEVAKVPWPCPPVHLSCHEPLFFSRCMFAYVVALCFSEWVHGACCRRPWYTAGLHCLSHLHVCACVRTFRCSTRRQ